MEIQIVKFEEAQPADYPTLIEYDEEGEALDPIPVDRALWERLEQYIAFRWGERQAVWTISGCGTWEPHLGPTSNLVANIWNSDSFTWDEYTPDISPLGGFVFNDNRTYKVTATLGSTAEVPPAVVLAYQRLAAYHTELEASAVPVGVASHSLKIGDGYEESVNRNPNAVARAMQHSGSADLLRSYRRI